MRKVALLEQVKGELTKFVPESVLRLLEKNPNAQELEKREADVSVLCLDVESYTRLSEHLPAQRLNRLIQDYFSSFLEIIRANHGDINETAGDGLKVIFQREEGPTRHALHAATAAVQINDKLTDLNQEFAGIYPAIAIHVGINSGTAFVGATKLSAAGGGPGRLRPRGLLPIWQRVLPAWLKEGTSWWGQRLTSVSKNIWCWRIRVNTSSKTSLNPCRFFDSCCLACMPKSPHAVPSPRISCRRSHSQRPGSKAHDAGKPLGFLSMRYR